MFMQMFVGVTRMHMAFPQELSRTIVKSEEQERAAGNARKPVSNRATRGGPEAGNG